MRHALHRIALAWTGAALLLAGCGGGGGGGIAAGNDTPAASEVTISGMAATGKPFVGASVVVYDRNGNALNATPFVVGDDGTYRITIPATAAAPLVVEAVRDDQTLVSTFAETKTTNLNITPLTNLIAARLAVDGNPLSLRSDSSRVTVAEVAAKVEEVRTILQPLTGVVGDNVDPLTGVFAANGTGHDQVLDSVDVQIRPTGTVSNIEITVKAATDEPIRRPFSSDAATVAPLPPVEVAKLPPVGIATLLDDLARRMTACFAVPFEQRVNGATTGVDQVTGNASDVLAAACRTIFAGEDPANFLSNGFRVGRDAQNSGAFAGLFRRAATNVVFDGAQLQFLRANPEKDAVFTLRSTDAQGNVNIDQHVARNENGTLRLIGNQYIYNARVRAAVEDREYVNQPAASNITTGYNLFVFNALDGANQPLFDRVEVTSPRGTVITLKPNGGRSQLNVVRSNGTISASSIIYLAARFRDSGTTGTPQEVETGLAFANPPFGETELAAIPEQGVWSMKFIHADGTTPDVIQTYKTTSRAPTIAEALALSLPRFTETALAELRAKSQANGAIVFGAPNATTPNQIQFRTAAGTPFWTVPAGARVPTLAQVFGSGPDPDGGGPLARARFDDSTSLRPGDSGATVRCTTQGTADNHCDTSTGVTQYAQGGFVNVLQLFHNQPPTDLSKVYALFYPLPR